MRVANDRRGDGRTTVLVRAGSSYVASGESIKVKHVAITATFGKFF